MKFKSFNLITKLFLFIMILCFWGCLKCPDDYSPNISGSTKKAPQLYAVLNGNNVVHLTWTFDSNDMHGYKIERKKAIEEYVLIDSISNYNYEDSSLIPDHYTYRIFAYYNTNNISDFSNEVTIAIP